MTARFLRLALFPVALFLLWRMSVAEIDKTPQENRLPALSRETFQLVQDSIFRTINQDYQAVRPILASSCFDCHSKFTKYPWYYKLPLVKSAIDGHIKEASESLDLSADFPFPGKEPVFQLLEAVREEVEESKMPPISYRLFHWGKLIEGAARDSLLNWIDDAKAIIKKFHDEHGHLIEAEPLEDKPGP
ncbi:MAG: heme-binding domain-containing protein [candidate division Zixibacteria bacterium]|nr:heme-binding domain-containing protein [candidate division Zixibacteria bacterium]